MGLLEMNSKGLVAIFVTKIIIRSDKEGKKCEFILIVLLLQKPLR